MLGKRAGAVIAASAATFALLLSGCSAPAEDSGDITLEYWFISQGEVAEAATAQVIADYEAANPGIKINVTAKGVDEHKDALRQTAGTSAAPDFYYYYTGLGLAGQLVELGASLDLTKYYEQYDWENRFTGPALGAVKQYGGYNGVPFIQNSEAIIYNKDLFAQAGITELPTTYDELVDVADQLVAAGIVPIEFGGTVNWYIMRLLDNLIETKCGADLADDLTGLQASWATTPCVSESFEQLKLWTANYLNPGWESLSDTQAQDVFFKGEAAMMLEGDWMDASLAEAGFNPDNLGLFAFPTGTGRLYSVQVATYVSSNTEHPDEVAAFLDYWMSPEVQQANAGVYSSVSVVNGIEPVEDASGLIPSWVEINANATGSFQNFDQSFPLDVTTEYWRIINAVAAGSIAPDDAGTQFQTFIDNRG